jgi:hypothetical protein
VVVGRRSVVGAVVATGLLEACGGAGAGGRDVDIPRVEPATEVPTLHEIVVASGLEWAALLKPRTIAEIAPLIPAIHRVIPEERFDRFEEATGFDLREIPEAIAASYPSFAGGDDAMLYVVRHNVSPEVVERKFRERLTGAVSRVKTAHDVVRVSGLAGSRRLTFVGIGRDVAVFQVGASAKRGPAQVAALKALGRLPRSPTLLSVEPLDSLAARFGPAPVLFLARGPFEGERARAARGLLAGATAVGAAARPSARDGVAVAIAVAGDFSTAGEEGSQQLRAAWDELAESSFGRLLGLDRPVEPPLPTHSATAVALAVELDPNALSKGLHAATSATVEEIMR